MLMDTPVVNKKIYKALCLRMVEDDGGCSSKTKNHSIKPTKDIVGNCLSGLKHILNNML